MYRGLTSLGLLVLPLLGAALTTKSIGKMNTKWYQSLNKAEITPEESVFPIAWSILYFALGLNAAVIYLNVGDDIFWDGYFPFFLAQLLFNYAWSHAFFKQKNPSNALLILTFMIVLTIGLTYLSYRVSALAFMLMVAYLAWLLFAYYLNLYVVRNN